jgi:opacity protein-like surface antigen
MGPNQRAQERERAAARAAAEAKRAGAERKATADAQKIVAIWNARQAGGRALWFYPTIGAAIAAGVPWLTYSCPACQQVGCIDLRTLDRHFRRVQRGGSAIAPNGIPVLASTVTVNANTQWLASARARLGFTGWFNNTMLYVTGGGARSNIEYDNTFVTTVPFNVANPSQTAIKSGWVIGGGAEWMATPNTLLRAEYLYYGIDSSNRLTAVASPLPAPVPVPVNWGRETIQVFPGCRQLQVLSFADLTPVSDSDSNEAMGHTA